jgi:hypothetical protein
LRRDLATYVSQNKCGSTGAWPPPLHKPLHVSCERDLRVLAEFLGVNLMLVDCTKELLQTLRTEGAGGNPTVVLHRPQTNRYRVIVFEDGTPFADASTAEFCRGHMLKPRN